MTLVNDCTQFSLHLKEPNLNITGFSHESEDDHLVGRIYFGELKLAKNTCDKCHHSGLVRNGYYKSIVKMPSDDANDPVFLVIKKQRLLCKKCGHSMMADVSGIVRKYCQISNRTRNKVMMSLQDDRTLACIAKDNGISPSTIGRWLDNHPSLYRVFPSHLPNHIAFDEVRGVHRQLHFICIDGANDHEIIKILPNRYQRTIINFFNRLPLTERLKVRTVSVDLNSYYQNIVTQLFPNAEIIIDRFHIISMFTRAFNQYRAQLMRTYPKNSLNYRLLKFSWRLYLKDMREVDDHQEYYDPHLRTVVTQSERIYEGLALDTQLNNSYTMMQDVMYCLKTHAQDRLIDVMYQSLHVCPQMKIVLNTVKQNLAIILNATRFPYSKGPLENTNRMIKQIQRTAFGMSNFNHLVARIRLRKMAKLA